MQAFRLTRYEPEVRSELFRLGHRNMPANVISAITLRTLMVLAAWNTVPHERIFFWLAVSVPSILASLALWWVFRRAAARDGATPPALLQRWVVWHAVCMCLLGLSAGTIGVLFGFNPQLDLLIGCAFVGVAAYSVAGNATHDLMAFFLTILTGGAAISVFIPNAFGEASVYMIAMTWLYMSILSFAASNSHGTVVNSIRLRLANAALAERNARSAALAEQANRDKSEFLAAASHDLRQPVHALLLFVEALRQQHQPRGTVPATGARAPGQDPDMLIAQIASAGQAISTMFNELMELSRLESGAEQARIHPVALAPLLQQCIDGLQLQASQKNLHLRLRIGRSARAAVIPSDRALLARMIGNLLSNAVRYTERGGVLLTLRQRPGGRLELAVHDSGIGIAPAQHHRIFEPYMQVGNPERDRNKGLGLGLAIVRQCLRLLGLTMQLQSIEGRGSRFRIGFDQWRNIEQTPARVPQPDTLVVRSLAGRRVLLIDDDAMVREAMQTVLGSWGVQLHTLSAVGDDQLQSLARGTWRPDCILCDYRMPGPRNGIDILDALTDVFPDAVGVLQTGERAEQVQAEADDAGYVVLYKPVGAAALASTLAAVLRATGPAPLTALRDEEDACTS